MPYRFIPLVSGEIYHLFNRSVARQPIFLRIYDYQRALEMIKFYLYVKPGLSFSHYRRLSSDDRKQFLENLENKGEKQISILAYCLMPNHFHFLLKGLTDNGITSFMGNFQNSYAKCFNAYNERNGSLFQSMFKAVRIETDEQLIHVVRYIHLNPSTAYIIKNAEDLINYRWSSFPEYFSKDESRLIDKNFVLGFFRSLKVFEKFTFDQANYQRKLDKIKHLTLENP